MTKRRKSRRRSSNRIKKAVNSNYDDEFVKAVINEEIERIELDTRNIDIAFVQYLAATKRKRK